MFVTSISLGKNQNCKIIFLAFHNSIFSAKDVAIHLHEDHESLNFICSICGKKCKHLKSLLHHIDTDHMGKFKCYNCGKDFSNSSSAKKHAKICASQITFEELPGFEDPLEDDNVDIKQPLVFASSEFSCEICQKSFTTNSNLLRHITLTHGKSGSNYSCERCHESFTNRRHLIRHAATVHKDIKCNICDKGFSSPWHLKRHNASVHPHEENIGYENQLPVEYKEDVNSLTEIKCPHCGRTDFASKANLKNHINFVHPKKDRYKCFGCPKIYSKREQLKEHCIRRHDFKKHEFEARFYAAFEDNKTRTPEKVKNPKRFEGCKSGSPFKLKIPVSTPQTPEVGPDSTVCYLCGQGFSKEGHLKRHCLGVHKLSDYDFNSR